MTFVQILFFSIVNIYWNDLAYNIVDTMIHTHEDYDPEIVYQGAYAHTGTILINQ